MISDIYRGIRVIESAWLPTFRIQQVRFSRSKKKRMRNKWKKRSENYKEIRTDIIMLNGVIYCSPGSFEKLKETCQK